MASRLRGLAGGCLVVLVRPHSVVEDADLVALLVCLDLQQGGGVIS